MIMIEGENAPASGTPWDALLLRTMAGKQSGTSGVILIQHSMPTPRQFAMESSTGSDGQSASGVVASEMIGHVPCMGYGAQGSFVADQAFVDLCHRCDGSVIFGLLRIATLKYDRYQSVMPFPWSWRPGIQYIVECH